MNRPQPSSGFTLLELVAAMSVLGIVSTTVIVAMGEQARRNVASERRSVAVLLARSMMEEVLSQRFEDPEGARGSFGTEEASRPDFDDVDDYDGYRESKLADAAGNEVAGARGFARSVEVHNVVVARPDSEAANGSTPLKRVTVVVTGANEIVVRLYALKADI